MTLPRTTRHPLSARPHARTRPTESATPVVLQMHFWSTREGLDVFALKDGFAKQRSAYAFPGQSQGEYESTTNPH